MTSLPSGDPPPFDPVFAQALLRRHVLIGLTVEDVQGGALRHEQFHGTVISADPDAGIELSLLGENTGQTRWLPPATHVFEPASAGVYTLRGTGEKVVDPDFTATWHLKKKASS